MTARVHSMKPFQGGQMQVACVFAAREVGDAVRHAHTHGHTTHERDASLLVADGVSLSYLPPWLGRNLCRESDRGEGADGPSDEQG